MNYLADIKKFKNTLVRSDIGGEITKMVWFGSSLKKKHRKESDVDILIITKNGEALRERIADLLLDFQMNNRLPIEIITSSIDELYPTTDHFLKNALTYGQEVYSMPEKSLRFTAANHYLSLAQEFLDSASDSIRRGHYRLGSDGAYNAAELAVKGLLVLKVSDLPGSHGGVAQRFGELYIRSGTVEREIGRRLNRCLEMRNAARYKFSTKISKEDTALVLSLAQDLINLLDEKLSQ